jgi:hypothetical protein
MAAQYTPRDSIRALWRQYRRYGEYRAKTAHRHPHTLRRSHLLAPAVVVDAMFALVAPRPLKKAARLGLAGYAGSVISAGLRAVSRSQSPGDAALVPLVLATMHFGHGTGMLTGARRHGLPIAAIASVAGLTGRAIRPAARPQPVWAPSLREAGGPQD